MIGRQAKKHPLDFDALRKGSVIPIDEIEEAVSCRRDHESFGLRVLRLKERIAEELRARGVPVTCCMRDGALLVLSDEEASPYNLASVRGHLRGAFRSHGRSLEVDVANLSPKTRAVHERHVEVNGKILQAAAKMREECALKAHERKTPGLPGR